jgi:senataxin
VIDQDEDVVMMDAPSGNARPLRAVPSGPTSDNRRSSTSQPRSSEPLPPTIPYRGQGIGGLNGRGEAGQVVQRSAGPPMIQTTTSTKKRHLEDGGQPDPKKVCDKTNSSPDTRIPPQTSSQNQVLIPTPNSPDAPATGNPTRPLHGSEGSQGTSSTGGPIGHGGAGLGTAIKAIASCAWTAKWAQYAATTGSWGTEGE